MLSFTTDILTEERNFLERDGKFYAYDKNGKEYEITSDMLERYWEKYGGRWKPLAYMAGGGLVGTSMALPVGLGMREMAYRNGMSGLPASIGTGAAMGGFIGTGIGHGARLALNDAFNDIAKKRLSGEFK